MSKEIENIAIKILEVSGKQGVISLGELLNLPTAYCKECMDKLPMAEDICIVCGTVYHAKNGDELIAEFLNWDYDKDFNQYLVSPLLVPDSSQSLKMSDKSFKFRTNWSWLMHLVEEIEECINDKGDKYYVCIEENSCEIYNYVNEIVASEINDTKIEAVYNTCVKFLSRRVDTKLKERNE